MAATARREAVLEKSGWRVAFFEGKKGSPRTGIIDAVIFRLDRRNADVLDLRLVQLKGGKAGVGAREIQRLREAAGAVRIKLLIAAFDGTALQILDGGEPA